MDKQSARAFALGLTALLLEERWPDDVQRVIQDVHDALVHDDADALLAARKKTINVATYATYATYANAAANAYTAAIYAAYAAIAATYAATYAAAYAAATATAYAKQALPAKAERVDALLALCS